MAEMKHMANKQMERHMNKAMGTDTAPTDSPPMPAAPVDDHVTCPTCGSMFDPSVQKQAAAEPDGDEAMQPAIGGGEEDWA